MQSKYQFVVNREQKQMIQNNIIQNNYTNTIQNP